MLNTTQGALRLTKVNYALGGPSAAWTQRGWQPAWTHTTPHKPNFEVAAYAYAAAARMAHATGYESLAELYSLWSADFANQATQL